MKKLLAVFLALSLLAGLAVPAFADTNFDFNPYYTVQDGNSYLGTFQTAGMTDSSKSYIREFMTGEGKTALFESSSLSCFMMLILPSNGVFSFHKSSDGLWYMTIPFGTRRLDFVPSENGQLVVPRPVYTYDYVSTGVFRELVFVYGNPKSCDSTFPASYKKSYEGTLFLVDDGGLMGELPPQVVPHTLTVNYQYTDGTEAAPSVIQTVDAGNPYSVSSPAVSGYTPNQSTVTGEMPDEDLSITVTYQKNAIPRTLSVQYRYSDGSEAAPTVTRTLNPGEHYSIVSPNLAGYVPSAAVVTGNMPDASKTVVITYHPLISEHTLTIHYQYEDGGIAAADYTSVYLLNSPYSVPSPSVSGYRPDQSTVSGRMPDEDLSVSVIYRKVADGGDDSSSSGGDPVVPGDIFGGYQFQDPFSDTPDWGSIFGGHTFRDPFTEPFTGDIFGGYQFHDPFQMPN